MFSAPPAHAAVFELLGQHERALRQARGALSKALKKRGFTFVGPTTMYALMEALGIVDTHLVGCHRRGAGTMAG